jgi:glutathione synthase/RimK-type ligase-like ATP-grasp enzyme
MRERHLEDATRAKARVALVTCAELPDLDPDDRLLLTPLADRGLRPDVAVWDDPAVDWAGYDLVVLRNPWDYIDRPDAFVAWAAGVGEVTALVNPADVIAWNTDKRYLGELAAAGVPVVPTTWVEPGQAWQAPPAGEFVVKPVVSAGSRDSGRYDAGRPEERRLAQAHVDRLCATGRTVMVQPYLAAVDTYGETALLFAAGAYSHAIRKGPMLTGPDSDEPGLYRPEHITPRTPTAAEHDVARRALATVPGGATRLAYARVDLIPGPDGAPLLVELEVTEPSLFLGTADGAPERFADAFAACVASAGVRSSRPPAPR